MSGKNETLRGSHPRLGDQALLVCLFNEGGAVLFEPYLLIEDRIKNAFQVKPPLSHSSKSKALSISAALGKE